MCRQSAAGNSRLVTGSTRLGSCQPEGGAAHACTHGAEERFRQGRHAKRVPEAQVPPALRHLGPHAHELDEAAPRGRARAVRAQRALAVAHRLVAPGGRWGDRGAGESNESQAGHAGCGGRVRRQAGRRRAAHSELQQGIAAGKPRPAPHLNFSSLVHVPVSRISAISTDAILATLPTRQNKTQRGLAEETCGSIQIGCGSWADQRARFAGAAATTARAPRQLPRHHGRLELVGARAHRRRRVRIVERLRERSTGSCSAGGTHPCGGTACAARATPQLPQRPQLHQGTAAHEGEPLLHSPCGSARSCRARP